MKLKADRRKHLADKADMAERLAQLGIPAAEMTDAVTLAVSALLEKLDDTARELVRAQENFAELEQLVDVDCLAPVPNRRAFMRRLAWALSMHERYEHPCSVLYFDINNFKRINDRYGHAAGDEAIRHVSRVLQDSLRGSDFLARLSGDEFAIIFYYAKPEDARERGRKLAASLAHTPLALVNGALTITVACGVYALKKGDNAEEALAQADRDMYADKKRSKKQAVDSLA